MNEQAMKTLRAAGFDLRPSATLDREGAVFALTDDSLIYLDEHDKREVKLRDITRIHSDRDGTLRVEAGSSTVITAALIGFEVPRVQHFFSEVRNATARAKTLPPTPSPVSRSPWKTGFGSSRDGTATEPAAPATANDVSLAKPAEAVVVRPAAGEEPAGVPVQPGGAPAEPRRLTIPASSEPAPAQDEPLAARAAEPIRINSAPPQTPRSEPAGVEAPPAPDHRAPNLERFVPTLRLLAVLMAVTGAGVGVLYIQAAAPLSGFWTIGIGAVAAFALYVFGEVVRAVAQIQESTRDRHR